MTTANINTREIDTRLALVESVSLEWTGHMPMDAESWEIAANEKLSDIGSEDVLSVLHHCTINGDDREWEIDTAIAIACEPDGLPQGACVVIHPTPKGAKR